MSTSVCPSEFGGAPTTRWTSTAKTDPTTDGSSSTAAGGVERIPNLAEETRSQLVDELMTARRQIRSAGNEAELENLRLRVADAKVALGERGPRWWDAPTVDDVRVRAAAIVRALTRANGAPPTAEVIAAASRGERIDLGGAVRGC